MSAFVPVYLSLGLLWGLLVSRFHPRLRELRAQFGERITLLMLAPTMLLWPVEVIGLIILLVIVVCRWLWNAVCIAVHVHELEAQFGFQADPDFHLVCSGCGQTILWSSEDDVKAAGWTYLSDVHDSSTVYWYCPSCTFHGPQGDALNRRNTDAR